MRLLSSKLRDASLQDASSPVRVLIIDDSAVVRQLLRQALSRLPQIEVVGTAPDALVGSDRIELLKPEVITLDLQMPRMDGLTFLEGLMRHNPLPVVVVSALTPQGSALALQAMELGALDVVSKPREGYSIDAMLADLVQSILNAAEVKRRHPAPRIAPTSSDATRLATPQNFRTQLIAMGASTGGTRALRLILSALPAEMPGILVVQHMPSPFTQAFAERLNEICAIEVREARHGDTVEPGLALIAPGGKHLLLDPLAPDAKAPQPLTVALHSGAKVYRQRPSVEVLFDSIVERDLREIIAVILTGMGVDGAAALHRLQQHGAHTIAQDRSSSVVFGMPGEAIRLGGVDRVLPLEDIPQSLIHMAHPTRDP